MKNKKSRLDQVPEMFKPTFPSNVCFDGTVRRDYSSFRPTPNRIAAEALREAYGIDFSSDKFDDFTRRFIGGLSLLATHGETDSLLGKDFNEFLKIYIETVNLCGRMKEALDQNGIEFDINGGDKYDN